MGLSGRDISGHKMMGPKVLLLGGTTEARVFSNLVRGVDLVVSLMGITEAPEPYGGSLRRGGFGGVEGFVRYLRDAGIVAVVDATHPFAARITANAVAGCAVVGVPLMRLERAAWVPGPNEHWQAFESVAAAVAALPKGAVGFLAAGRSAGVISPPKGVRLILRAIEAVEVADRVEVIQARPPFDVAAERALFAARGVTHLICKNAGGVAGRAKLDAAAALGLPAHMVARPARPAVSYVETVEEALVWVAGVVNGIEDAGHRA